MGDKDRVAAEQLRRTGTGLVMEVSGPNCQWWRANTHLPTVLDSDPGDQKAAPSHFYCSMGFSR